jgi:prolyl-tRNA editing enzyme YbaK/EbsC (Cys-tRNA(Pro) deacylase)
MEEKLDPKVLEFLKENNINFEVFECDPDFADTYAFCEKYGFELRQSANTILIAGKGDSTKFVACVALASTKLDVNHKVCEAIGVKRASFASSERTKELTGMEIGGVTVFGLTDFPILIDEEVFNNEKIVMGGGNRSSKVLLNPKELKKIPNIQIIKTLAVPKAKN